MHFITINLMKKIVLIIIISLFGYNSFSQTISGKVHDQIEAIPYANVVLKDANKHPITGTITTEDGLFEIKTTAGNYVLEISYLGYKTWKKEIQVGQDNLNLGTITLDEETESLDEIVIKSNKNLIEKKIDRLVFNVEKSIAATGGNGVDVLRVTPGVQLQNNTLSILGKGATQVMINGRLSPLTGDDLMSFLNGFSASDIKKIEVITNPPAKYDAAGNGGLVNIILKKGVQNSWKNATTLSYHQNRYNFTTLSNNFFYNKDKISFSGSLNVTKGNVQNLEGVLIDYPTNLWDIDIKGKMKEDQVSGRLLFDYALSDKTTVGFQYLGSTSEPDIEARTLSTVFDNDRVLERSLLNFGDNEVINKNQSLNFHLISQLDSLGKSISFDADFFRFNSDRSLDFFTEQFDDVGVSQGISSDALNTSNRQIENFSSKIDFEFPLQKVNLSYGVKASFTNSKSGVSFFNMISGTPVFDPTQSNDFEYQENVLAAYFSGNSQLNKRLKIQFGLRFEDTKTEGIDTQTNQANIVNYSKLFPSLYLSFAKNDTNTFNFSYGRRINRPNFRNLNPFRFFISDNSFSVGNPFLQPSFSDNFEISHLFKNNFNTSLSLSITTDGFGVFFNTDTINQNQIVTRENYFTQYVYRLEESFSHQISWWKSQNSFNALAYITKLTRDFDAEIRDGIQFYIESNHTFSLSESSKIQLNSWYSSRHDSGLFSVGELLHVSLGFQHHFQKSNVKMSMFFSDIFNTGSLRGYSSRVNGINQNYRQNESSRNFRVSLSYDFGNKKIKVKNRAFGNDTERMRSN